jgi:UDP-N-acetylmuramoyl-L-alanyl-D-glutamate--2,6-diaminopimelate ligase
VAGAIEDGAVAILTDREGAEIAADALSGLERRPDRRRGRRATLAHAAALWFGPGPETVVAVTGTNGKTSVASFTRQIWERLGHRRSISARPASRAAIARPASTPRPTP